jgi:tubulin polyglutamylase complex subunit 2
MKQQSQAASHPKAIQLNAIGFQVLSFLESQDGIKNIEMVTKEGVQSHDISLWERKHIPFTMSSDLKAFYSVFNGILIKWGAELGMNIVPVGEIRVNSIEALVRIPIDGRFVTSELAQAGIVAPDPNTCAAFVLDSFCEFGYVVLIFRKSSGSEPEVWFQDLSARWHYICSTFKQYMRVMILHLGIIGWQMAYSCDGLTPWTQYWMRLFCKERLCIDLNNYNSLITGAPASK